MFLKINERCIPSVVSITFHFCSWVTGSSILLTGSRQGHIPNTLLRAIKGMSNSLPTHYQPHSSTWGKIYTEYSCSHTKQVYCDKSSVPDPSTNELCSTTDIKTLSTSSSPLFVCFSSLLSIHSSTQVCWKKPVSTPEPQMTLLKCFMWQRLSVHTWKIHQVSRCCLA